MSRLSNNFLQFLILAFFLISLKSIFAESENDDKRLKLINEIFNQIDTNAIVESLVVQEKLKLIEVILGVLDKESRNQKSEDEQKSSFFQIIEPSETRIDKDPVEIIKEHYQGQEFPPAFEAALRYLQSPEEFIAHDKPVCNTFLFSGPPGCGKSYMAELMHEVFKLPIISISASGLHNKYIGVGSDRIAELFSTKDLKGRVLIIFIDEIDGMANRFQEGSHQEAHRVLTSLLVELQKNANNPYIFVITATNCKNSLDPALLSRFEGRCVEFPALTQKDREKFIYQELPAHCNDKLLIARELAKATDGMSRRVLARLIKDVDMYTFAKSRGNPNYFLNAEDFLKQIVRIKQEQKIPFGTKIKSFVKTNITYINLSISILTFIGIDYLIKFKLPDFIKDQYSKKWLLELLQPIGFKEYPLL